jgi:hypothetical protein
LSRVLADWGDHADALVAARNARTAWHAHSFGSLDAARADLQLGAMLLICAAERGPSDSATSQPVLAEALELLCATDGALESFGVVAEPDLECCRDRIDFAQRLRGALEAPVAAR